MLFLSTLAFHTNKQTWLPNIRQQNDKRGTHIHEQLEIKVGRHLRMYKEHGISQSDKIKIFSFYRIILNCYDLL